MTSLSMMLYHTPGTDKHLIKYFLCTTSRTRSLDSCSVRKTAQMHFELFGSVGRLTISGLMRFPLTRKTYNSGAFPVLVWLGPETETSDGAVRALIKLWGTQKSLPDSSWVNNGEEHIRNTYMESHKLITAQT